MPRLPKLTANARLCLVGAAIFGLFGLFMLPWSFWSRSRIEQMLTWPTVEADIVATGIASSHVKYEGTRYRHELTYRFTVAGRTYTGDRVSYGGPPPRWHSEAEARRALSAHGGKVRIRYNPRDPRDTVIHIVPGSASDENVLRWLSAGGGLAGFGLMLAAGAAWRRERRQAALMKKLPFLS